MGWKQSQVERGGLPFHALALCKIYSPGQAASGSLAPPAIEGWCFQLRPTDGRPWSVDEHPAEAALSPKRSATLEARLCRSNLQGPQIKVLAQRRKTPAFRIWLVLSSVLRAFGTEFHLNVCFPGGSEVKASASSAEDPGSIPGLGRSPGEGNGNPLQCSCLENPMDGETW